MMKRTAYTELFMENKKNAKTFEQHMYKNQTERMQEESMSKDDGWSEKVKKDEVGRKIKMVCNISAKKTLMFYLCVSIGTHALIDGVSIKMYTHRLESFVFDT